MRVNKRRKNRGVSESGVGVLPEVWKGVAMENPPHRRASKKSVEDFGVGGDAPADASGAGSAVL